MLIEQVKKLSPIDRLCYWVRERHQIYLRRKAGKPRPWTDDEILRDFRFCNVVRIDDKVSRWLLENWYKPNFDHPNMVIACALARFINLPSSLEAVGFPIKWNPQRIKKILREVKALGKVFNGAYVVRGNDGEDKIASVVDYYVEGLNVYPIAVDRDSMENTWAEIIPRYGFGSFMAGQVVADLRWAMRGKWADRNTWAPVGPGSTRGLNRLLGWPTNKAIPRKVFLGELLKIKATASPKLHSGLVARMEAHDWQNCLCEFSKYDKALQGEGFPKQRYREGVS